MDCFGKISKVSGLFLDYFGTIKIVSGLILLIQKEKDEIGKK